MRYLISGLMIFFSATLAFSCAEEEERHVSSVPTLLKEEARHISLCKDLSVHQENATLLRENVERRNPKLSSQDVKIFYKVDFAYLPLRPRHLKEVMPSCLRVIQAIAEDQASFVEKYRADLKVKRTDLAREATLHLIENIMTFADKHNEDLMHFYVYLTDVGSQHSCMSEVEDSFHTLTCETLLTFPRSLDALIRRYRLKLVLSLEMPPRIDAPVSVDRYQGVRPEEVPYDEWIKEREAGKKRSSSTEKRKASPSVFQSLSQTWKGPFFLQSKEDQGKKTTFFEKKKEKK